MGFEIRKPRVDEFDELVEMIDQAFQYGRWGGRASMAAVYPYLFQPTEESMQSHNVLCDQGRIVANVSVFPLTLVLADARLSVGGIGMVGTLPEYRGRGLMTQLLRQALVVMKEANLDLSLLGGDRQRYGRYGWENSGRKLVLTVNARSIRDAQDDRFEIRKARADDAQALWEIHQRAPVRFDRTVGHVARAIERAGYETLVAVRDDRIVAYTAGAGNEWRETGGDPRAIVCAVKHALGRADTDHCHVHLPMGDTSRARALLAVASRWNIEQQWMMRVMNLETVLAKLAGVLGCKLRTYAPERSARFSIEDLEDGKSVQIACDRGTVHVAPGRTDHHWALSKQELVALIFGTMRPSEALIENDPFGVLDLLFPVDYFLSVHDNF